MDDHRGRFRSVDPADEAKTQLSNPKGLNKTSNNNNNGVLECPFKISPRYGHFILKFKTTNIKTHNINAHRFVFRHTPTPPPDIGEYIHAFVCTHTHAHTCVCRRAHTHTHTHTQQTFT